MGDGHLSGVYFFSWFAACGGLRSTPSAPSHASATVGAGTGGVGADGFPLPYLFDYPDYYQQRGNFPPNFMWGAATASYQVEGGWDADGKGPSIWDTFTGTVHGAPINPGMHDRGQSGAIACDSYHKSKEDVALLKRLGLSAYRFSISWPRILPNGTLAMSGGAPNAAGVAYYNELIDELIQNGIEPFVTVRARGSRRCVSACAQRTAARPLNLCVPLALACSRPPVPRALGPLVVAAVSLGFATGAPTIGGPLRAHAGAPRRTPARAATRRGRGCGAPLCAASSDLASTAPRCFWATRLASVCGCASACAQALLDDPYSHQRSAGKWQGWLDPRLPAAFAEYAELCFRLFGDRVRKWLTLNEPLTFAVEGESGLHAPSLCNWQKEAGGCTGGPRPPAGWNVYIAGHHALLAHGLAVEAYRTKYAPSQRGQIGIALNGAWYEPYTHSAEDIAAAARRNEFEIGWFAQPIATGAYPEVMRRALGDRLPALTAEQAALLKGSSDFFALNMYSSLFVRHKPNPDDYGREGGTPVRHESDCDCEAFPDPSWPRSNATWLRSVPWGMRKMLLYLHTKYAPAAIYITENGWADGGLVPFKESAHDVARIHYLANHTAEVLAAANEDGVRVAGYFAWSLLDKCALLPHRPALLLIVGAGCAPRLAAPSIPRACPPPSLHCCALLCACGLAALSGRRDTRSALD